MGVVLVQQIDLLDVGLVLHEGRHRLHLHRGIGIEAEMPIAAFAVGQIRVDGRMVQVNDFLAGVALVVLVDCVQQGGGDARAVALAHIAYALVEGGFEGVQRLSRAELVVEDDQFELDSGRIALVELFLHELEALHLVLAHRPEQTRQRVDEGDFDRFTLLGERGSGTQTQGCGQGDQGRFLVAVHRCLQLVFEGVRKRSMQSER